MERTKTPKRGHSLPHGAGSFYYSDKRNLWVGTIEAGWNSSGLRRRITVSARDENTAWNKLQAKRKLILAEGIPQEGKGGAASVASWASDYLKRRKNDVKPQPYRGEASAVTKWIIPTLGHRKLVDLTPSDVRALGDAVVAGGNKSTHARYVQRTLLLYLKAAVEDGHLVPQRVLTTKKRPESTNERASIPLPSTLALLTEAHKQDDHSRWDGAFLQGIRQGEALGLLDEFVNFRRHEITIWWTLQELVRDEQGKYVVPEQFEAVQLEGRFWLIEPKSKNARRTMPMIPAFERQLAEWMEKRASHNPHGLLWPRANGMPRIAAQDRAEFRSLQDAARTWKTAVDPDNPASKPTYWVPQEARHTTVSLLLELNVPREVIEKIVGHSELVENYVHVSDARVRDALASLGAVLQIADG